MCKGRKILTGKIKITILGLWILLATTLLINCAKTVVKEGTIWTKGQTISEERKFKISLKVYNDPEVDYSSFKKFRLEFRASEQINPLLDKYLRSLIKDNMIGNGFVEDNENPDFIVMGSHQNTFIPDRDAGIKSESGSFSGYSGGRYFQGTYNSGDGLVTAIVKAKLAQRYWIHEFGMAFFDPKASQVIWIGNATAYVRVDDIRETSRDILKALLDNYPEPNLKKKRNE